MPRVPMLVDCDPGVDDALALLTAARLADLVGVTTVTGNVGIDHTTHNALAITQIAELDVPVHRGAPRPLVNEPVSARHVHGPTGLGTVTLPRLDRTTASDDAVAFILESAERVEGLHLVAIGPLTNIALALREDPTLPDRIGGLTIMGGAVSGGNVTAAAEFNIWADPEAAAVVFEHGGPLTMVGLDVTHQVLFGASARDRMRQSDHPAAVLAADLLDHAMARSAAMRGWSGAPVHDACAVIAALEPGLFATHARPVRIELDGALTRGMTVVDERGPALAEGDPSVTVVHGADADTVVERVVDAVTSYAGT